jgi:hypothetical protein
LFLALNYFLLLISVLTRTFARCRSEAGTSFTQRTSLEAKLERASDLLVTTVVEFIYGNGPVKLQALLETNSLNLCTVNAPGIDEHVASLNYNSEFSSCADDRIYLGTDFVKDKAIPVRDRGGPYGCETSRLPHFLDNRFTDGGEVVSLMHRPPFTPRKTPGTHFC